MNLQVVYCNHRTAPLAVRERLAFASAEQLGRAYGELRRAFPDSEVVVLSTCNRVELYAAQERLDSAPTPKQFARFLSEFHDVPLDDFLSDLLEQRGPEAVRHLFEVACGIDSMVLGEPQIVSQVKEAYQLALKHDACGPLTNALFQGALRVSARVRSETRLAEGRMSIASVAVGEFGKSIFDRFDDKQVLVVGAGEMAEETLRYLKDEGVRNIVVVNRSRERAENVASRWGGTVRPFEALDDLLAAADVVVSTTGAERPIVDVGRFKNVLRKRNGKPVFILDLGAPRDFEPAVGELDDSVFLYDIDSLEKTCRANRRKRHKEIEQARRLVQEETDKFLREVYHQATGPVIKRLREEWHDIRQQEVERLMQKLSHLDESDRNEIEKSVERIVNKLLHPPLKALKDESRHGPPHGLVDALKRLFHLGD